MSDWTQAQCEACWNERNPHRQAHRMRLPEPERCAFCGQPTTAGIYVRVDPATVPFPTREPP
jgi:hypothetical protein